MTEKPSLRARMLFGLAFGLCICLSGCGGDANAPGPTLAATVSLPTADVPTSSTPTRSATPPQPTMLPSPTETDLPLGTSKPTLTAWAPDTATPGPSPTPTHTPTRTRIPTRTIAPTRTPTITYTPTITLTPTPPPPTINLVRPGLLSKLVSPIQTEFYAVTGADGNITLELVGEDGVVIARKVVDYNGKAGRHIWNAPDLAFEISGVAETARLQVSTRDNVGRIAELSSVDVVLLSVGRAEINASTPNLAPYMLWQPADDAQISGGLLVVSGLARPVNASPVIIELVNENGNALITKQITIPAPADGETHTPFSVEIPYKVDAPTPLRLIMRQEGSRIPGTVALTSVAITLNP